MEKELTPMQKEFLDILSESSNHENRSEEENIKIGQRIKVILEQDEELNFNLENLPDRHRDIIRLYYGIGYEKSSDLDEIGQKYHITRERVRQIKSKALNWLETFCLSPVVQKRCV